MNKRLFIMICFLLSVSCINVPANAAVPHLINYQGRLTDSSNAPLNGSYALTFRIYDAATAGNLLWEENQLSVVISKGLFAVLLGSVTALNLPFDKPYYLEIKVGTEVMTPRQQITSAGYAFRAEQADRAKDSDTVGGVGVSITPNANKLVPLDGAGKLPTGLLGNSIAILTGKIGSGEIIPLPVGYTQDQCRWLVSLGSLNFNDDQHTTQYTWDCSVGANRIVSITYKGKSVGGGAYANYIIIGVK